ncbi:MAG: hypothetical protein ABIK97_03885 [candidate division WOR-3 bacterium]
MPTRKEEIITKAIEILKSNPNGLRYSELVNQIKQAFPEIPKNTIQGTIWNLERRLPNEVYKPVRGLFRLLAFREKEIKEEKAPPPKAKISEEDFYRPFADYLVNELEECTKAIPLGGNRFEDKWGTPDVIGKRESRKSDIVKGPIEIVSAEIKTDTRDLITAFGQACCYKLFSHKSYLVIPKDSREEDISKLDALCLIFGIGLVLFDNTNPEDPDFQIRVRPIKHEPDMFYVNQYMREL